MGLEFICHRYIVFIYFSFCSEELFVCSFLYVNQQFSMTSVLRVTVASMNLLGLYRDVERCRCRLMFIWLKRVVHCGVQAERVPRWWRRCNGLQPLVRLHHELHLERRRQVQSLFILLKTQYLQVSYTVTTITYIQAPCVFVHFARFFFEWYLCESVFDSHKKCEI